MIIHTLRDSQARELASRIEDLLTRIPEKSKHEIAEGLLFKLKACEPNYNQAWAHLTLSEEEDTLFEILCKLTWGKPMASIAASPLPANQ